MSKVRILFLGTPDFAAASLERLIEDDHYEIAAVISQPDRPAGRKMQLKASPVKELALKHGLEVLTPESVNTEEFLAKIQSYGAESAVVVAFGQILSQKFLDLFPRGCVNVHASVLPRWRGAAPIQRAIMEGDRESGVSLQIIVRKLDAGPVLGTRTLVIDDEMDAKTLHDNLKLLGADLLHIEYMDYLRGNLTPVEQDESRVTFAAKISKSEARLDWSLPARTLFNRIRGLAMGPFAYCQTPAGATLKIHKTKVLAENEVHGAPGEVVQVGSESFAVACGQGLLEVLEVQPESRSRMKVAEYLRGYPVSVGQKFD